MFTVNSCILFPQYVWIKNLNCSFITVVGVNLHVKLFLCSQESGGNSSLQIVGSLYFSGYRNLYTVMQHPDFFRETPQVKVTSFLTVPVTSSQFTLMSSEK